MTAIARLVLVAYHDLDVLNVILICDAIDIIHMHVIFTSMFAQ